MPSHHHVLLSLMAAALVQGSALAWSASQTPRIMEAFSGASAALTAVATYLARGTYFPRQTLCTVLMAAWGCRLSWYLFQRNLKAPVSARSLCVTRTLWAGVVAFPVVAVNAMQDEPESMDPSEVVGATLAGLGLLVEALADAQKAAWHGRHGVRPGREADEPPVCASGLWAWSRHPNLFGEVCFHAGIYMIVWRAVPVVVVAAPLVTLYLVAWLRVGPLCTLEREKDALFAAYPAYLKYRERTSALFPMPPCLYQAGWRRCPRACAAMGCV